MDNLLANIIAQPDLDAPRLAYAAAIKAHDPHRSRFIELQLQAAGQGKPSPEFKYAARDLLEQYGRDWGANLVPPCTSVYFHRGLVAHVAMTMADFLMHGDHLVEQAPIQHLNIGWSPDQTASGTRLVEQFFASPLLARMRSLSLDLCRLRDEDMACLAASPNLAQLEWLKLTRNDIGEPGVRALASSAGLPKLRYVGFFGNPVDPTEELFFEQGIVIDRELPALGMQIESEFGPKPWLHLDAVTSWDVPPPRY